MEYLGISKKVLEHLPKSFQSEVKILQIVKDFFLPSEKKDSKLLLLQELNTFALDIKHQIMSVSFINFYTKHEETIRNSFDQLRFYLEAKNRDDIQYWKELLIKVHNDDSLRCSIKTLLEGFDYTKCFNINILNQIIQLENGNPTRIKEKTQKILNLIVCGLVTYNFLIMLNQNVPVSASAPAINDLESHFVKVYYAFKIRERKKEVEEEMISITKARYNDRSPEGYNMPQKASYIASKIYDGLSKKYQGEQWLVILLYTGCCYPEDFSFQCTSLKNDPFELPYRISGVCNMNVWAMSYLGDSTQITVSDPVIPSEIPKRNIGFLKKMFHPRYYRCNMDYEYESAEQLAKLLLKSNEHNNYLVTKPQSMVWAPHDPDVDSDIGGWYEGNKANPDIRCGNESIVRTTSAGKNCFIIYFPSMDII